MCIRDSYEVWVTADDEFVLLKAQVTGYMMTQYELVWLDVAEAVSGSN